MPPRAARSPSSSRICTSTRSFSILIGQLRVARTALTHRTVPSRVDGQRNDQCWTRPTGSLSRRRSTCPVERMGGVVLAHPHPTTAATCTRRDGRAVRDAAASRRRDRSIQLPRRRGSGGEHDDGLGERLDIVAAIELLSMFVDGAARARRASRSAPTSRCPSSTPGSQGGTRSLRRCALSGRRLRGGDRSSPQAPRGGRARPVQPARRGASRHGDVARHRGDVHPRAPTTSSTGGCRTSPTVASTSPARCAESCVARSAVADKVFVAALAELPRRRRRRSLRSTIGACAPGGARAAPLS